MPVSCPSPLRLSSLLAPSGDTHLHSLRLYALDLGSAAARRRWRRCLRAAAQVRSCAVCPRCAPHQERPACSPQSLRPQLGGLGCSVWPRWRWSSCATWRRCPRRPAAPGRGSSLPTCPPCSCICPETPCWARRDFSARHGRGISLSADPHLREQGMRGRQREREGGGREGKKKGRC